MKKIFLNAALIALTIGFNSNSQAQVATAIAGENTASTITTSKTGETVLDGVWGVANDKAGNLVITDKNNSVVRMIAGAGKVVISENGRINCPNCPFSMIVDKAGNLHIADNTIYSGAAAHAPVLLAHETNNWGDPDRNGPVLADAPIVSANR